MGTSLPPITGNSTPARQAYSAVSTAGYRGRLPTCAGNIRFVKDNPYIKDLPDDERAEANLSLLVPFDNEIFYDDEGYQYIVFIDVDPVTGVETYTYISKTKELSERLNYYESSGVLNQLMAAYNNGKVYNFYFNHMNHMMYPNTSLVFPEEFSYYTVRRQDLNMNSDYIYVAGGLLNDEVVDTKIGMQKINDTMTGNSYTRMNPCKIFDTDNPAKQYSRVIDGNFYVVDFYDATHKWVDTKLFQAINSAITNTKVPSQSVTDLLVTVIRDDVPQTIGSGAYPIYAGDNLSTSMSYIVVAVYGDGTHKLIDSSYDSPHLVREGFNVDTTNAAVGDKFEVKFTYYPLLTEDNVPIGTSVETTVTFQVVQNVEETIVKALPVLWSDMTDNELNTDGNLKVYKLKLFTMDKYGVIQNKSHTIYNTLRVRNQSNEYVDWYVAGSVLGYDPYHQQMLFTFADKNVISSYYTQFRLFDKGGAPDRRMILDFSTDLDAKRGLFIKPYPGESSDYGYGAGGVLQTLAQTYGAHHELINNEVKLNNVAARHLDADTNLYELRVKIQNETDPITIRYRRTIDGQTYTPNEAQVFVVKDATLSPVTKAISLNGSQKEFTALTYNDNSVQNIVGGLKLHDYLLVKFYKTNNDIREVVNFDVFNLTQPFA